MRRPAAERLLLQLHVLEHVAGAVAMSQYFGGGDGDTLPIALRVGVYGALA